MIRVSVSILRANMMNYLKQAQLGEEIVVTSHGQSIARIMPAKSDKEMAEHDLLQLRKTCKLGDVVTPMDAEWKSLA